MHVVYDHQIFSFQPFGGVSRYFVEVADRLRRRDRWRVSVLALAHVNEYLRDRRGLRVLGHYRTSWPGEYRQRQKANDALTRVALRIMRPDIAHETYFTRDRLAPKGTAIVTTVHDMIHERFAELFPNDPTTDWKRRSVERADHVICVSAHSRQDMLAIYPALESRSSVVHHGQSLSHTARAAPQSLVDGPYLLFVGQRRHYKNFLGLLRAYARSPRLVRECRLVCFGGDALEEAERRQIRELGLPDGRVVHLRGNDDHLATLYAHATAFVCPSLYEGFGLPPLEAMAFGCPVVCSNTSSLPEVVGDAAELVDPASCGALMAALERVTESADRRAELARRGRVRAELFTWDATTERSAAIYRSLA